MCVTARWSFLFFWMAYAGRAMATLFGPGFAPLARRGREFGLAYAAAMLTHVGLLIWILELTSACAAIRKFVAFSLALGLSLPIYWPCSLLTAGRGTRSGDRLAHFANRGGELGYILYAFAL